MEAPDKAADRFLKQERFKMDRTIRTGTLGTISSTNFLQRVIAISCFVIQLWNSCVYRDDCQAILNRPWSKCEFWTSHVASARRGNQSEPYVGSRLLTNAYLCSHVLTFWFHGNAARNNFDLLWLKQIDKLLILPNFYIILCPLTVFRCLWEMAASNSRQIRIWYQYAVLKFIQIAHIVLNAGSMYIEYLRCYDSLMPLLYNLLLKG